MSPCWKTASNHLDKVKMATYSKASTKITGLIIIRWAIVAVSAILTILMIAEESHACGSEPLATKGWALDHFKYSDAEGLPFLSPGNDSRINLLYLMSDANGWAIKDQSSGSNDSVGLKIYSPALFALAQLQSVFSGAPVSQAEGCSRHNDWKTSFFDDGEGSRCRTLESGSKIFAEVVEKEDKLTPAERAALISARQKWSIQCDTASQRLPIQSTALMNIANPSKEAKAFLEYLMGAAAFYEGQYKEALDKFSELQNADNPWIKQTALYMSARTLINKAQLGVYGPLDGVSNPKVNDAIALIASELALKDYLRAYPDGLYSTSARGLLRRVYWLAGDKIKLSNEYVWQLSHMNSKQANATAVDLVNEIDAKLFITGNIETQAPVLQAVVDLMKIRSEENVKPELSSEDLDKQASYFLGNEELFAYLKAAHAYYVEKKLDVALGHLGEANYSKAGGSYISFSREMLRGQIFMASNKYRAAIAHWNKLLPTAEGPWQKEAVELGLAMSWERQGVANKIFEGQTRLSSPRIRGIMLRYIAGPILLRKTLEQSDASPWEQNLARFVLLFKEATRGQYVNFIRDYDPGKLTEEEIEAPTDFIRSKALNWSGVSEPYKCGDLISIMRELARAPNSSHGALCIAEFVRTENLDDFETGAPAASELGGTSSIFPGKIYSRGEVYKKLIASRGTPRSDRAYALYRAINCYAPTGHNQCGGVDVAVSQRRHWFNELKSVYGDTSWATSLKYFW